MAFSHSHLVMAEPDESGDHLVQLNLDTGERQVLPGVFDRVTDISAEQGIWIAGDVQGVNGIWRLGEEGPELILASSSAERITDVQFDSVTGALYFDSFRSNLNLEYFDAQSQQLEPLESLNTPFDEDDAALSPDGQLIYFVSNRAGGKDVWAYDRFTKVTSRVTALEAEQMSRPCVSLDGQLLAVAFKKRQWTLATFDIATGAQLDTFAMDTLRFPIAWAHDKRHFYTTEYDEGFRIRRYDRELSTSRIFHENGWMSLAESRDGKYAFFPVRGREGIVKKEIATGDIEWLSVAMTDMAQRQLGQMVMGAEGGYGLEWNGPAATVVHYPYEGTKNALLALPKWVWVSAIRADGGAVVIEKHHPPTGSVMRLTFADRE